MRAKALMIGALAAWLASAAAASTPTVPKRVAVEIRGSEQDRAQTILAILEVCTYLEEAYPKSHKRADCLDLLHRWVPKSDK